MGDALKNKHKGWRFFFNSSHYLKDSDFLYVYYEFSIKKLQLKGN